MNPTGTFSFCHGGNEYHFHFTDAKGINRNQPSKLIYLGTFQDKAPAGLKCNTEYCLKHFPNIQDPAEERYAQCREAYDLLDYNGEHLRKILFRNDAAARVCQLLQEGKAFNTTFKDCITIEPCYRDLGDYFKNCNEYPTLTRLRIVLQFAQGLRELTENTVGKKRIVADRDVKWENSGNDAPEGEEPHIRLLDFASVYLVSDPSTGGTVQNRRRTLKFPFSEENTTADSLLPRYSVSEHTDVYALGMLLASLFMTANGQYSNPNRLWLQSIGRRQEDLDDLVASWKEAFNKVADPDDADTGTWIEAQLKECTDKDGNSLTLAWESDPTPPQILQQIRSLFRIATRIDPGKRCSLAAFTEALERIIASAQDPGKKFPVSVFLFNRANCARYKTVYQEAAQGVLLTLNRDSEKNGLPAHHALCISYGSLADGSYAQEVLPLSDAPVGMHQLAECVENLKPAKLSPRDHMLYGLYKVYQSLQQLEDRFSFDGRLFLFTLQVPDDHVLEPFPQLDRPVLFKALESKLAGGSLSVHAYTVVEPNANSWCKEYTLLGKKSAKNDSVNKSAAKDVPVFQTGKNAPYIKLPNGQRAHCGIIPKKQEKN